MERANESVEDVERFVLVDTAYGRDRVDERTACEHCHPVEQLAFVVVEERVRPLDGR